MNKNNHNRWDKYIKATLKDKPRLTLAKALALFENQNTDAQEKVAIDLGCGAGADTIELIKNGWRVLAIDKEQEAIDTMISKLGPLQAKVKAKCVSFEELNDLRKSMLVNSSLSLPFCNPRHFDTLWELIEASIIEGGRFAGDFFGVRDDWSNDRRLTFHTRNQIYSMFSDFEIEYFKEWDEMGATSCKGIKHWHRFSVVARKR